MVIINKIRLNFSLKFTRQSRCHVHTFIPNKFCLKKLAYLLYTLSTDPNPCIHDYQHDGLENILKGSYNRLVFQL